MSLQDQYNSFNSKAKEIITWFEGEISSLRTGRVSPELVSSVAVEHYGTQTPLTGLASVNNIDARTLQIAPWDESAIAAIEKAIIEANVGAQPAVDGKVIRLSFPMLNEEIRSETIKLLHKKAEEARIRLRQARDEALSHITAEKKAGDLTEDDYYLGKKELNNRISASNDQIDNRVQSKETEIKTV